MSERHPSFRVIQGGADPTHRIGQVTVVAAPGDTPPFPVDAYVVEEDTFFVLSADAVVKPIREHPVRIFTEMLHCEPADIGTMHTTKKGLQTILKIVLYDMSHDPITTEPWIVQCLDQLLQYVAREGCHTMAVPVLGHHCNAVSLTHFIHLLQDRLEIQNPKSLSKLWLIVD